MSFASRWVEPPAHVTEAEPGLPQGFRAAGVACGLKPSGGLDLGLLVSDEPATTSAARFTRSGVLAAPVLLTQERCRLDALSAPQAEIHHVLVASLTASPGLPIDRGWRERPPSGARPRAPRWE